MLDGTPKLKAFYEKLVAEPKISAIVKDASIEAYYARK